MPTVIVPATPVAGKADRSPIQRPPASSVPPLSTERVPLPTDPLPTITTLVPAFTTPPPLMSSEPLPELPTVSEPFAVQVPSLTVAAAVPVPEALMTPALK